MPLKIFVSSVSNDFEAERRALESGIRKLGELYDGMEYYGSDPRSAAAFDHGAVGGSDLYVGLFGDRFGSIDATSQKSFTELEYDAARAKQVPTLAYFSRGFLTGSEDPRQAAFKQRVRQDQLGAVFHDAQELEVQFLIDLFKQIRGPLFAKMRPHLGAIPFDALHAVTKSLLPEQIKEVGRDKYKPELYVPRPVEERVRAFIDFEQRFVTRSQELLHTIELIAAACGFEGEAKPAISNARDAVLRSQDLPGLEAAATALKRVCFFDAVEADFARIEQVYRQKDQAAAERMAKGFAASLRGRPYVDSSRLTELSDTVFAIAGQRSFGNDGSAEQYRKLRSIFPSILLELRVVLANDLLKELDLLIASSSKRCIAIVDRAGRGKTNVACRIAETALEKHAVVLLSGRMELSTEYHIEWHT